MEEAAPGREAAPAEDPVFIVSSLYSLCAGES